MDHAVEACSGPSEVDAGDVLRDDGADDYVPRHRRADTDPGAAPDPGAAADPSLAPHPRGHGFRILSRMAREHADPGAPEDPDPPLSAGAPPG